MAKLLVMLAKNTGYVDDYCFCLGKLYLQNIHIRCENEVP